MLRLSYCTTFGKPHGPSLGNTSVAGTIYGPLRIFCGVMVLCGALHWRRAGFSGCGESLPDGPSPLRALGAVDGSCVCEDRCTGTCTSKEEDASLSSLANKFLLVDSSHLQDASKPRLRGDSVGWIVWYLFGMFYMFIAIAIVCDEFFVPALEAFVDEFGISMDVAGATFMAAGGSMPELFTNFIGTFQETDVGIAAIVGSAVFNVLFVIAVCAIASREVLVLTWWPLARDCSFYLVNLLTVVWIFTWNSENEVETWEALILLAEYILYCLFMRVNGRVYDIVSGFSRGKVKVQPSDGEDVHTEGDVKTKPETAMERSKSALFNKPSAFRAGIVQILTHGAYVYETAGIAAVTQMKGDLEESFRQIDKDGDGFLSVIEIKDLLTTLGCKYDSAAVRTAVRRMCHKNEEMVSLDVFKRIYLASEARIEVEIRRVFDRFDQNSDGFLERDEIVNVLRELGHKPTDEDIDGLMLELFKGHPGDNLQPTNPESRRPSLRSRESANDKNEAAVGDQPLQPIVKASEELEVMNVTFEQFQAWYNKSLFFQGKMNEHENEEEEEDGSLSLEFPEGATGWQLFWYIFTYPICAVLHCCLPDVRKPRWQRNTAMAVLEFCLCLIWIGLFSLYLFECTIVCCNTVGIPPPVAGVTLLAAGTSIPDLLSSFIVARRGNGDMAVSSSIGSNIFDVTVGFPLPWLCYNIFRKQTVKLTSKSLGFSVLVLIFMLVAVISTICAMKWRMTKTMGYIMLMLYVVFITQQLLQEMPEDNPVWVVNF